MSFFVMRNKHSFKSPAIAEDIAGYSYLRLVKLRAIARYIPLHPAISLFSLRYYCFRGHPLHTLSRRFKTLEIKRSLAYNKTEISERLK
jgi:hypothetical protein